MCAASGRIDRSTLGTTSPLDVFLCVCHLQLVNGYLRGSIIREVVCVPAQGNPSGAFASGSNEAPHRWAACRKACQIDLPRNRSGQTQTHRPGGRPRTRDAARRYPERHGRHLTSRPPGSEVAGSIPGWPAGLSRFFRSRRLTPLPNACTSRGLPETPNPADPFAAPAPSIHPTVKRALKSEPAQETLSRQDVLKTTAGLATATALAGVPFALHP